MDTKGDEAFVSLTTNDDYACGAIVLGLSLKRTQTQRKLVLLVTEGVSGNKRGELSKIWDELIDVEELNSKDDEHLALISRPELGVTFTKLKIWTLTQFKKCVFLDADTLVLQNVDDLFARDELSASPDIGWPDCFNTGVFVFVPSLETFNSLICFANQHGSFDGGDQGLLNMYFNDWNTKDIATHLPFVYNMVSNVCYTYAAAYKKFGSDAKIVHFLGAVKPWHYHFDETTSQVSFTQASAKSNQDESFVQKWWETYSRQSEADDKGASAAADHRDQTSPAEAINNMPVVAEALGETERKASWERGFIDYGGADSFENIQEHLDTILNGNTPAS